jgi:hypothetical protein
MGLYILPRAENKVAATYIKDREKIQAKLYRIRSNAERTSIGVCKRSHCTPSWTRGVLPLENLDKKLSKIILRVPQKEDETTMCIF